jgi:hypothetical protein
MVGYAGCTNWRNESPRVGGSIPPLATINQRDDTDLKSPISIAARIALRRWLPFRVNRDVALPRVDSDA